MTSMDEDNLVQKTVSDYLYQHLDWEIAYAYNEETFGENGTFGRKNDREVILTRYLERALKKLNPGKPEEAYHEAIRQICEAPISQNIASINREKYQLYLNGVKVQYKTIAGQLKKETFKVFDFDNPSNNDFLAIRELWIRGSVFRKRADIVGFVNGIPLIFVELKNVHRDLRHAYDDNIVTYFKTIPSVFYHNAMIILGNGHEAKIGSVTSHYKLYHEWKRLEEGDTGIVDMETLLKGVFNKKSFLDIFENFILFDESRGDIVKIVARNHQYLGVNKALDAVKRREEREGKLGVFWHTQGSGKSYSIAFFTQKIHRKIGGQFTFLICTDRDDLDKQIYTTFAGCGLVNNDRRKCRATSGEDLKSLLQEHSPYIFTLIQKFNKDVDPVNPYSERNDIIVISDEAHRTQYGRLALNMRNALPVASRIGFTGTPLFKDDEITRRVFGDYVSTYDFQRAVEDGATVPLYYDSRGEKLGIATNDLNEKIARKLEEYEFEDIDTSQKLEEELKREYHVVTAEKRLRQVAKDFVDHYSCQWENGKAMLVCIDKVTCVKMHEYVDEYWQLKIREFERRLRLIEDEQELIYRQRQLDWMRETMSAVVVSEEQGEVAKFEKWGIDILPHRKLLKEGFETSSDRVDVETAFKKKEHPFRIAIVCAMWLTGFDVPSLSTLYLDKPLKAHTLMQAIARANRVYEGKNNGLIVDYCGILRNLRKALATFAGHTGEGLIGSGDNNPIVDPVRPQEELIDNLKESIALAKALVHDEGQNIDDILTCEGFERINAILKIKEVINQSDETRKRFEISARDVFRKFKACLTTKEVNSYRKDYDSINIVYKSLQDDKDNADISHIIKELHGIVDDAIETHEIEDAEPRIYDISKIDFDRLRREFERNSRKNTTVQNLKAAIEEKLRRMIQDNPLRVDLHQHYVEIVKRYNLEKDRVTIEKTFEELLRFVEVLSEEESRALREGLDEESLVLYDILIKPELSKKEIDQLKKVAAALLQKLKAEKLQYDSWQEKESTRDSIYSEIYSFLYDERIGLPSSYDSQEIEKKAKATYEHIFSYYTPQPRSNYQSSLRA